MPKRQWYLPGVADDAPISTAGAAGVYPLCWLDAIIRIVTPNKRDSEKTKIAPSHLYLADLLIKSPVTD